MCDCGKPSTTEAKTEHAQGATAPASAAAHGHAAHDATADAQDATCGCAPTGQGHHASHAGAATSA